MLSARWLRTKGTWFVLLVLAVVPLLACGLVPGRAARATPTAVVVDTVTAEDVVVTVALEEATLAVAPTPTVAMQTFVDPVGGYAIDLPAEWFVTPYLGGTTVVTSWDMNTVDGHGGLEPGMAKVDIVPDPKGWPESIDEMAAQAGTDSQVLEQYDVELGSGTRAIRMTLSSEVGGIMSLLFAEIDGHRIIVQGYGELTLFDTIAATLRPAAQA